MLLQLEGLQVSDASSGNAAIDLVDGGLRPDVILLDFRMPGLNGGETLRALRTKGFDAPALLVTAAAEAGALAERFGFEAVLRKPVSPDELVGDIQKVLFARDGSP